jgi:hypothetical protein
MLLSVSLLYRSRQICCTSGPHMIILKSSGEANRRSLGKRNELQSLLLSPILIFSFTYVSVTSYKNNIKLNPNLICIHLINCCY